MRLERLSTSEAETIALGEAIGRALRSGDVVAIVGELGAGKTRLVRGIAIGLRIDPKMVSSPTYALVHEYKPIDADAPILVHVDAYRLQGADDLASLGWRRAQDDHAVVVIEWADRVADDLPAETLWVTLEHSGGDGRSIVLAGEESWIDRLSELS